MTWKLIIKNRYNLYKLSAKIIEKKDRLILNKSMIKWIDETK
jgi:hypothetical protein